MRGLIGEKLTHSFSKQIHEKIRKDSYELIRLNEEEFHQFMKKKEFEAINVTIPYKEKVIPYCDVIDEKATQIQAINCIRNDNGVLYATNTDFDGLRNMILNHSIHLKDKIVAICGTGGTSKTAKAVALSLQAKAIYQVGRNKKNCLSYEEMKQHQEIEIIINTTSVGMYPNNDEQIIDLRDFPQCVGVIDVIYNPLTTALCLQAKQLGIPCVNGLEMLVGQALKASEFFYQDHLDPSLLSTITKQLNHDLRNIVLIGMPSCGKSTIGKKLATLCQKDFVDLDEEIVQMTHQSIPEIFATQKEEGFRQLEIQVCQQFASKHHQVIACGGGIIKNEINIQRLKQNGILVYIQRDVNQLLLHSGRPLSTSREALIEMEKQRHPLYLKASDIQIYNHQGLDKVVQEIKEKCDENFGN